MTTRIYLWAKTCKKLKTHSVLLPSSKCPHKIYTLCAYFGLLSDAFRGLCFLFYAKFIVLCGKIILIEVTKQLPEAKTSTCYENPGILYLLLLVVVVVFNLDRNSMKYCLLSCFFVFLFPWGCKSQPQCLILMLQGLKIISKGESA